MRQRFLPYNLEDIASVLGMQQLAGLSALLKRHHAMAGRYMERLGFSFVLRSDAPPEGYTCLALVCDLAGPGASFRPVQSRLGAVRTGYWYQRALGAAAPSTILARLLWMGATHVSAR
jgi:hypothetical protein